jgi:pimeloyl-ACP methyl ester carboxylesterase
MKSPRLFLVLIVSGVMVLPVACGAAAETSEAGALGSRFATFGTNKVHYVVAGQGHRVVVFVHGWGGNTEFWKDQVPALKTKARLILIDLPGHGKSDKPRTEYTMDVFAQGVVAVLRDARVQRATLVGHSMGTPVICRVYSMVPDKVAALVAVDGLLRRPKGTPQQFEAFVAPYRTPEYREHTARFITTMFPNPGTEKLRDWTLAQVLATPQHVLSGAMDGMFKPDQPAWDLGKVTIPVMAINAKSPMWTPEYETYVRGLSPKTDYRAIGGVGHFLMYEKPAQFNEALLAMLQQFDLID